jgi:trehalose-6-phosphate synthase
MKQTAVEWLAEQMLWNEFHNPYLEKAKEMEKEQRIMDYNAGHADGICNHINDADNYINEQNYLKGENID